MNQISGNKTNTQNTNMVSAGTQSIQFYYRTSNEQSATNSSDCADKELRETHEGHCPTGIAKGASMANKPSENAGSGGQLDADSIAQCNSGRGRTSPTNSLLAAGLPAGGRSIMPDFDNSSDEDNGDLDRSNGSVSPIPITQRHKRPRCDSTLSEDEVVDISAAEQIASLKDQLLAEQRSVMMLKSKNERLHQEIKFLVDQVRDHRRRITELEEKNIQLKEGNIPVLKYCHEQKAEMNRRIGQDYDEGTRFVSSVLLATSRFCTDTHADTSRLGLVTLDSLDAYIEFQRTGTRCLNEINDTVNFFQNQSLERVWDLDRLITQEESRAEAIRFQIDSCMKSVQALSEQRKKEILPKRDEFSLVFQEYYGEFKKIKPGDEVRANQYDNICKDLDILGHQNCAAREL